MLHFFLLPWGQRTDYDICVTHLLSSEEKGKERPLGGLQIWYICRLVVYSGVHRLRHSARESACVTEEDGKQWEKNTATCIEYSMSMCQEFVSARVRVNASVFFASESSVEGHARRSI